VGEVPSNGLFTIPVLFDEQQTRIDRVVSHGLKRSPTMSMRPVDTYVFFTTRLVPQILQAGKVPGATVGATVGGPTGMAADGEGDDSSPGAATSSRKWS
jgi:hypothetical protein